MEAELGARAETLLAASNPTNERFDVQVGMLMFNEVLFECELF